MYVCVWLTNPTFFKRIKRILKVKHKAILQKNVRPSATIYGSCGNGCFYLLRCCTWYIRLVALSATL